MAGNQYKTYEADDRRSLLASLVSANMSLNEMRRVHGFDYRTVKRHYPDYHAFEVGGGGDAAEIRETNRQLQEFLRRGKIGKNRDSGFNVRGGR